MDTLNRVLLIIVSALVAVASFVGILLAFGTITLEQIQSVIPYQRVGNLFNDNVTAFSLVSILLLAIVLALGLSWLRGQFSGAVTAVVGGRYEMPAEGPGSTTVSYAVVEKAINNQMRSIRGVVDAQTRIYAERDGGLFAHSNITVKRNADIHAIDSKIRESINREWLNRLGSNLVRHDLAINLQSVERRVA